MSRREDGALHAVAGTDALILRTLAPLRGEDLKTVGRFAVTAGQRIPFVLTYVASHLPVPAPTDAEAALAETEAYWQEWAGRCRYTGEWSDAVLRSHIILKALTYRPTGAIVASATASLPERVGGSRNWDYRFCWLRDATFTLLSLMNAGYEDEALAWRDWLLRAVAGSPWQMQAVYGLAGEKRLAEWEIPSLPGHEDSTPVRIGNAAFEQLQLDVYGEVMDAMFQAHSKGMVTRQEDWQLQRALVEHLTKIWREPDEGIWEVRGAASSHPLQGHGMGRARPRHQNRQQASLRAPIERWCELRQAIHDDVCRNGFDPEIGSFVQSYGSKRLDASLLLMPLVGFLPAADARMRSTVDAIMQHLTSDGFVLLRHGCGRGRIAAGRGGFPGLQLLARRQSRAPGAMEGSARAVRASAGAAQ